CTSSNRVNHSRSWCSPAHSRLALALQTESQPASTVHSLVPIPLSKPLLSKGREGVTREFGQRNSGLSSIAGLRVTTSVRPRHRRPCHLLFARGCAPDSRPAPASRTIPTPGGAPGQERGPRRTSQPGLRSIGG